mmetsp:Transcript_23311/g.53714  ORF Transcript_23311/g.53714 Transcript_23311/m.53714 type:complete len:394 (-) Transcript_23311:247-1428(-)
MAAEERVPERDPAERFQQNEDLLARVAVTDLNHFYRYVNWTRMDGPPEGFFTKYKPKLSNAIHGKVHRADWHSPNGTVGVALKTMPIDRVLLNEEAERNDALVHRGHGRERFREDAMTEIGVYFFLNQQPDARYQLRMMACFADDTHVFLATQHATGGDLFNFTTAEAEAGHNVDQVRRYMSQLLQAVHYLHSQDIGHRDISLENILLMGKDQTAELRLMDFGQAVALRSGGEDLRYFTPCGKPIYTAPEMRVPPQAQVEVQVERNHVAGDINQVVTTRGYFCHVLLPRHATPGERCQATTAGYTVRPSDIFACGICLFVLAWGRAPWQDTLLTDRGFIYVGRHGYANLVRAWRLEQLPEPGMKLLQQLGNFMAESRPVAEECLRSEFFDGHR